MSANTKIQWTTHTFNPWWGCTKVSEGCKNCYAERLSSSREPIDYWNTSTKNIKILSDTYWQNPIVWNKQAARKNQVATVFSGSMCDIFSAEGKSLEHIYPTRDVNTERQKLFALIKETTNLFWLLLTKRPQNIAQRLPKDWADGYATAGLGVSVETQKNLDRIKILTEIPTKLRFLSLEPLLERLPKLPLKGVDWVIVGGESGADFRPMEIDWVREIRDQCLAADVPFFFKQLAGKFGNTELPELDGVTWSQFPSFGTELSLYQKPASLPQLQPSLF
jgi:protein gp37